MWCPNWLFKLYLIAGIQPDMPAVHLWKPAQHLGNINISQHISISCLINVITQFQMLNLAWICWNTNLDYKMEVIFLWTLIFVWTIWAIYLLDLLAQTLDFSLEYIRIKKRYERISEYIRIKKMIRTNIRIYSYQKNNTNEYPNIFASKKWYEYDTNEYLYRKIFEYIRISEYSPDPGLEPSPHSELFRKSIRFGRVIRLLWKMPSVPRHLYRKHPHPHPVAWIPNIQKYEIQKSLPCHWIPMNDAFRLLYHKQPQPLVISKILKVKNHIPTSAS